MATFFWLTLYNLKINNPNPRFFLTCYIPLLSVTEISVQQGQDILSKNSEPMFFTSELNAKRRLIALNIASKYVESSKQCMEECLEFNTTKCQSINYAIKKGENGHMCELNAPINPNDVAKFIYDPRFVHYSLL